MPTDPDYQAVCAYLKSLNIHFSERWVCESIKNVRSANFRISSNDLKKSVYEKWLSTNLRDIKVGSLPPNVTSFINVTLTGTYAVQVESMINSARSCYSELQKLENPAKSVDADEKSEDAKSKRCLTFRLCDGVQEVQAMEYQLVPNIRLNDPNFLPGFKIVIKGPVICRKGMLLLTQENVKVYGGKVESLYETNNLMTLLRTSLGVSINKEGNNNHPPATITDPNVNPANLNIQSSEITPHLQTNYNISDEAMEMDEFLSQNDDFLLGLNLESGFEDEFINETSRQDVENYENCVSVPKRPRTDNYHDVIMEENNKNLFLKKNSDGINQRFPGMERKSSCNNNKDTKVETLNLASTSRSNNRNDNPPVIPTSFDDDSDVVIIDDDDIHAMFQSQYNQTKTSSQPPAKCTQMKMSLYLTNVKKQNREALQPNPVQEQTTKTVRSYPFVYLKQIENKTLTKPMTYTVKAIILTLKSRISIKNDEFILKAVISDGSSTTLVDFSSETVENIIEYSPCEVKALMDDRSRNSAVASRLRDMFSSAQQKLLSMNCLMKVKFFNDDTTPVIVGLEEVQSEHVKALKARSC